MKTAKRSSVILLVLAMAAGMLTGTFSASADVEQRSIVLYNDGVDVVMDGVNTKNEWDNFGSFEANFDVAAEYEGVDGFTFVKLGSPTAADGFTNDDLSSKIRVKVDGEYLYFYEERTLSKMFYANDDAKNCYLNNGGIIFFVKKNNDNFENLGDIMYQPRGKTNTEPTLARRTYPGGTADDNIEYTAKSVISETGYTIEAKVKMSTVNVTLEDLRSGDLYLTYVAANSFDESIATATTKDNYCQFNYFGIGVWNKCPQVIVRDTNPSAEAVTALIGGLGAITEESGPAILAAREAYDALPEELQKFVANYETLTDAEYQYKKLTVFYGDINNDTEITAADALMALQCAVDKITLTDDQLLAADIDGTEGVTAADALLILQYAVNKITSFPVQNG